MYARWPMLCLCLYHVIAILGYIIVPPWSWHLETLEYVWQIRLVWSDHCTSVIMTIEKYNQEYRKWDHDYDPENSNTNRMDGSIIVVYAYCNKYGADHTIDRQTPTYLKEKRIMRKGARKKKFPQTATFNIVSDGEKKWCREEVTLE